MVVNSERNTKMKLSGKPLTGLWTTIHTPDGSLLKSGFTPLSVNGTSGNEYRITIANYDGKIFQRWQDNEETSRTCVINLSANTTLTAVYNTGNALRGFTSLTYSGSEEQPDLTVNAVTTEGSKALNMWAIIDPESSNSSGTTYRVYATNGYQDKVFDHWEDGSTNRIRTLTIDEATTVTAYYQTT